MTLDPLQREEEFEKKKQERAKRFGSAVTATDGNNKRTKLAGSDEITAAELEKRLARAKKFGVTSTVTEEFKKEQRKQRFASK